MAHLLDQRVYEASASLTARLDDHPVHTRSQLLDLGISDALQSAMLRRGTLTRLRHGVYVASGALGSATAPEQHRIDLAAAIASGRAAAWAFGPSASVLLGMALPYPVPGDLTIARPSGLDERALHRPTTHRLTLPGVRIVTGPVDPTTTSTIRGVPVVSPALAAISSSATFTSARWQVASLDAALWRGATPTQLAAIIDEWRHLGHRDELLAALDRARPGAQTPLETLSRLALVDAGLPEPKLQHPFHDAEGLIGRVDMWWPELGVVGEADGAIKYTDRDIIVAEKRREDRLRALGVVVVRWMWIDITEHPEQVAARIRAAARRAA